ARLQRAEIDVRVVLAKQPDRNVVTLLSQYPHRLAALDDVFAHALDTELREERFLQGAMIFAPARFELIRRDFGEVELDLATDPHRCRERCAIQLTQLTRSYVEPLSVVTQCFGRLNDD